jgi:hypothetical protein
VGEISALSRMASTLIHRPEDRGQVPAEALRFVRSNTPFANLFYARLAIDYALMWRAQEALSPGYLERYERRLEEERGVEFIVRPTDAA